MNTIIDPEPPDSTTEYQAPSSRQRVVTLDMNVRKPTLIPETSAYYRQTKPKNTERRGHLVKTKYCFYGEDCPNRSSCNFAHTMDEIRIPNCMYGARCRLSGQCQFRHPSETTEQYIARVNHNFIGSVYTRSDPLRPRRHCLLVAQRRTATTHGKSPL